MHTSYSTNGLCWAARAFAGLGGFTGLFRLVGFGGLLGLFGCGDASHRARFVWPVAIDRADTPALRDSLVSITGTVVEQSTDRRRVLLDDQSGVLWVATPSPLPALEQEMVSVVGVVRATAEGPVLQAREWAFVPRFDQPATALP